MFPKIHDHVGGHGRRIVRPQAHDHGVAGGNGDSRHGHAHSPATQPGAGTGSSQPVATPVNTPSTSRPEISAGFEIPPARRQWPKELVRIGIGGPVGAGKSHLVLRLCEALRDRLSMIVITNDIYTREDAQFLTEKKALPAGRIMGVETGGCPHTAIRDDISLNADALELLYQRNSDARLALIESGGDNLSATFSPDLVDYQIYVIDVAQGDDIPRKGGLGIGRSDLLVVNKMDLAPYVGVDLQRMNGDLAAARGPLPYFFTNLRAVEGLDKVITWIEEQIARGERAGRPLWAGMPSLVSSYGLD